jgi:xanthine dehydrogenase large subunit
MRPSQDIDGVQKAVAHSLGLRHHDVEAVCRRVGGGFGGKAMRNFPVAVGTAVAAAHTGRPVRFVQDRCDSLLYLKSCACIHSANWLCG